ncbi:MAG: methylated-DNA--[protein]-cysteine S-methyltransferase [Gaiellaceae bacterium]
MNLTTELDRRFRDAAAAENLLDVGFDVVDSPIGPLLVAATGRGICRVWFKPDPEQQLDSLARTFGSRVLRSHASVESAHRQLDEYFAGRREGFELEVDLRVAAPFARHVLEELARVPYGQTTTYGTLAARVGAPSAARAVGTVMNRNPIPIVLPCHRVVGANGSLTGYAGGLDVKERLLRLEGALL